MRSLQALAVLLLLAGCAPVSLTPGPAGPAEGRWRQQAHGIPLRDDDGAERLLQARICRPVGDAPARLVVIAHGAPPVASARARVQLPSCDSESVSWFLQRGFAVALALRRGYGMTGGPYVESARNCTADDYAHSARESAEDLLATIRYATALPYVRPDGAVVVGQSAGGWATVGLDSLPHPQVAALVSMAGGRGGQRVGSAIDICQPENLAAAAGLLGRTAHTPMLWVFTANDSYFAPPLARAMHDAFVAAGGQAELIQLGPFGSDGHQLFPGEGGSLIWGPLIEHYLRERGAL